MELVMVRDTTLERLRAAEAALLRIRRGQSPTTEELAKAPQLDFWTIAADDRGSIALAGVVTGHPLLREGATILTSELLWIAKDLKAARTVSRFYRLGVPFDGTEVGEA